jgi:hypothetical protein
MDDYQDSTFYSKSTKKKDSEHDTEKELDNQDGGNNCDEIDLRNGNDMHEAHWAFNLCN